MAKEPNRISQGTQKPPSAPPRSACTFRSVLTHRLFVVFNKAGGRVRCQLCRKKFSELFSVGPFTICDRCTTELEKAFGLVETCESCGKEKL